MDENNKKIKEIASKKASARFFKEDNLVRSANTLLIAPDKGIFIFNPIFFLGIFGVIYAFKKLTIEKSILISLVLVNLFFYSSWGDPWGGWAFGPRYLIPSMAILSLFVALFLVEVKYKFIMKIVAFVLLAFSVAVSLLGALTTNAVPPITEAIPLKMKSGFPFNIDFLLHDRSSSYVYTTYFHSSMNLIQYYEIIFGIVMAIAFIVLFILPYLPSRQSNSLEHKKKRSFHGN